MHLNETNKEGPAVKEICLSPSDKKFVSCAEEKEIRIWDLETKKMENILGGN